VARRDWGKGRERERRDDECTHHVSRAREEDDFERAAVRWVYTVITRRVTRGEVRRKKEREALGRKRGGRANPARAKEKQREGIKSVKENCGTVGPTSQLAKPSAGRRREGKRIARPSPLHFNPCTRCHLDIGRKRKKKKAQENAPSLPRSAAHLHPTPHPIHQSRTLRKLQLSC
jgi:hypothetical protein